MSESLKTITLKLHDIGSYKKNIIDEAMINYSRAFQYLLDALYCDIENIKSHEFNAEGYSLFDIKKMIGRDLIEKLNEFNIEPFKDSLIIDFSAVISGYLNSLKNGREQSYPAVFISDEKFEYEYNELMNEYIDSTEDADQIDEKIRRLVKHRERLRPIFFCRYSISRNYCLIYDPDRNRYYAKIYLMNVKNEKRKVSIANTERSFKYISKENKILKKSSRKNCFLVFPLSFGSYQEEYLKKALKNPETLRTARLIKKKGEYFLSISIIDNFEQSIQPLNYMGIARGIDCAVSYAVVDLSGKKVSENFIEAEKIPVQDCEINRVANVLLKISKEHRCQVIMENLQNSRDRLTYTNKNGKILSPVLRLNAYDKLLSILDNKVKNAGLPGIIKVSGRDIFYSCTSCGNTSRLNRFSENIMICTKCGTYNTVEKSGSLNLARKLIKYSNDKIIISVEETEAGIKFINEELGFEFFTQNPLSCIDEFHAAIDKLIKEFYENIIDESKNKGFMKKLSMIKKIEKNKKIFQLKKKD